MNRLQHGGRVAVRTSECTPPVNRLLKRAGYFEAAINENKLRNARLIHFQFNGLKIDY
ncbi:hypothetical protein [Caballeronia ptereochthonis]|uniref:hypothetical protein n=1 Tax=Caballeronia ptereochthonis TaxID=1777144 RepID=UPI00135A9752|nr:hypothetical protein [Caballeronia ptereochthonis]